MAAKTLSKDIKTEVINNDSKDESYEKYLTEMKELPAYERKEEKDLEKDEPIKKMSVEKKDDVERKVSVDKNLIISKKSKDLVVKDIITVESEKKGKFEEKYFSVKDIILGIINLFSIIFLIVILSKFPTKAQELKDLRNANTKADEDTSFLQTDLSIYDEKVGKLSGLFLEESGIVEFLNALEKLQVGNPTITKFTVESQEVVKDKTDNFGLPVSIEMKGNWEDFERNLSNIQNLKYLFRPVKIEVEPSPDEPGVIRFKYGLFLYVNDKIGENR